MQAAREVATERKNATREQTAAEVPRQHGSRRVEAEVAVATPAVSKVGLHVACSLEAVGRQAAPKVDANALREVAIAIVMRAGVLDRCSTTSVR